MVVDPPGNMDTNHNSCVLVLQFGGLGDLVLISELIGSLKAARPEWTVTLVCRAEFSSVAGLFPIPPDAVAGLDLNPYLFDRPSDELRHTLEGVVRQFDRCQPDILIDGSLTPTWLSWFLADLLQPGVSFGCGIAHAPEAMLSAIRDWFGLTRHESIELGPPPEMHERDRYALLLDHLKIPRVAAFPWAPPAAGEPAAREWLGANALEAGGFVACFPGGAAATPLKRWPAANFVRTLDWVQSRGLRVLLFGGIEEREELIQIAGQIDRSRAPLFCGDSARLPLAAAVLSKSAAYLGNDTGPVHLAQAYGVPGVAIFGGGGQWPRFAPWAAGSIGLVHPLPCFGCDWDCFLGRGLCVESVPVEAVSKALSKSLEARGEPEIVSVQTLHPAFFPILADASARYRLAQRDRARRMEIIFDLIRAREISKAQAAAVRAKSDAGTGEFERAARERLALVEAVHAEASVHQQGLRRLTAEIADRERRITAMQAIAEERLAVIERIAAEAAARQSIIEDLTAAVREREIRISALERAGAGPTRNEAAGE
jgi:ADP-heptose:LPS heptosyltransferase/Arc/MetJ-type ribon-helix-helix transcriptional regulator